MDRRHIKMPLIKVVILITCNYYILLVPIADKGSVKARKLM